ncbi:MAG TPA: GDP-mannose 4,6-dehydratase, partial [Leptospiraceae bacterium]|nr:GDP-mannose 4,6-dehydratase [Leptospiraceae bacterium]
IGIDNLSQSDGKNMNEFLNHSEFEFYRVDIMNESSVLRAAHGCSGIIHMAAYKIPRYSDALDTLKINGIGSENLVKAAIENNARLVAASTSDVYGMNPELPFKEDSSNLVMGGPKVRRWAYAISKMFEEQMIYAYGERMNLDFALIRFFGGYGPGQNLTWWGGPQSVFINKALDDEEIEVHGDGQQTRSFTHVSDHVDGVTRCLEVEKARGEVFNIGNDREITIENLAKLIWKMIRPNDPPKIKMIPYETFGKYQDVMRRIPDLTKSKSILGFEPKVKMEDGLKTAIEWQIKRRKELGMTDPKSGCVFKV